MIGRRRFRSAVTRDIVSERPAGPRHRPDDGVVKRLEGLSRCVGRGEQVQHVPIFTHDAVEEELDSLAPRDAPGHRDRECRRAYVGDGLDVQSKRPTARISCAGRVFRL